MDRRAHDQWDSTEVNTAAGDKRKAAQATHKDGAEASASRGEGGAQHLSVPPPPKRARTPQDDPMALPASMKNQQGHFTSMGQDEAARSQRSPSSVYSAPKRSDKREVPRPPEWIPIVSSYGHAYLTEEEAKQLLPLIDGNELPDSPTEHSTPQAASASTNTPAMTAGSPRAEYSTRFGSSASHKPMWGDHTRNSGPTRSAYVPPSDLISMRNYDSIEGLSSDLFSESKLSANPYGYRFSVTSAPATSAPTIPAPEPMMQALASTALTAPALSAPAGAPVNNPTFTSVSVGGTAASAAAAPLHDAVQKASTVFAFDGDIASSIKDNLPQSQAQAAGQQQPRSQT